MTKSWKVQEHLCYELVSFVALYFFIWTLKKKKKKKNHLGVCTTDFPWAIKFPGGDIIS